MAKGRLLAPLIEQDLKAWKSEKRVLMKLIAEESRNFFEDNFKRQGFLDGSLKSWKPRKKEKKKSRKTKKFDKEGRGILIASGQLSKSLTVTKKTRNRMVIRSVMATSFNYSGVHNYGLRAGRGSGFKMPERKFMGKSKTLDKKIVKLINFRLNKAFRK